LEKFLNIFYFSANQEQTGAMTNLVATFLKFAKARNIFHFVTHLKHSNPRTYLQMNYVGGAGEWRNDRSQLLTRSLALSTLL
jgi:hypothetical protein